MVLLNKGFGARFDAKAVIENTENETSVPATPNLTPKPNPTELSIIRAAQAIKEADAIVVTAGKNSHRIQPCFYQL